MNSKCNNTHFENLINGYKNTIIEQATQIIEMKVQIMELNKQLQEHIMKDEMHQLQRGPSIDSKSPLMSMLTPTIPRSTNVFGGYIQSLSVIKYLFIVLQKFDFQVPRM
jgi:hypothetical protein